jgi:D-aspartate ligase
MTATTDTAVVLCTGINALGVIRALARRHVRVVAVYFEHTSPVRFSRAAGRKHRFTAPPDDATLLGLLAPYGSDHAVVLACSDHHADFLSRCRSQLLALGLQPAGPSAQLTEVLNDKARELELMMTMPVTLPTSLVHLPGNVDELLSRLKLPIIVKPRSHRQAHLLPTKNVILRSRSDAERFVEECHDVLAGFVAQEVIAGPDEALWVCNCCFDANGDLISAFTFQRIRTSPSHFGVTSFAIGRNNEAIKQQCAAIGKALADRKSVV